jgi:hypothetical protein
MSDFRCGLGKRQEFESKKIEENGVRKGEEIEIHEAREGGREGGERLGTCLSNAMSLAKFALSTSFSMACPPYFTTTVAPRKRAMCGSAWARMSLSVS